METNKEVAVQVKIDRQIVDQIKKIAKEKGYIFSAYVRTLILEGLEKEQNNG